MKRPPSDCFKTDQAACYNEGGDIIPCRGTGQDGETNTGEAWPDTRFLDHNETIVDALTGLMWTRSASPAEFPLTWEESLDYVSEMNGSLAYGYRDWRLPDRRELFSLISHSRINPALPTPHPFTDVFNGYYWTASPCARLPRQAWYVHLGGGRVFKGMKHGSYMVWPVRSTDNLHPAPAVQLTVEDAVVHDPLSGLTWLQAGDITGKPVTWIEAFSSIRRMNRQNHGNYSDWRLPNIRELESLIDITRHSPAISESSMFTDIRPYYWSSTTSVYDPGYAWTLYTQDGNIGVGFKSGAEFFVWGVRGGQPS